MNSPSPIESEVSIHPPAFDEVVDSVGLDETRVPIKIIGFEAMAKPTELPPLETEQDKKIEKQFSEPAPLPPKEQKEKKDATFSAPGPVLDYLKKISVDRANVKNLIWDITDRASMEEVVKIISNSTLITPLETRDVLSLLGIRPGVVARNTETEPSIDLDRKLIKARENYIKLLGPYLENAKKNKDVFRRLMESLGGVRSMPQKDEPSELIAARDEYYRTRRDKRESLGPGPEFDLGEIEMIRRELVRSSPRSERIIIKAEKTWGNLDEGSADDLSVALNHDFNLFSPENLSPSTFSGLRVNEAVPAAPEPEVVSTSIINQPESFKAGNEEGVVSLPQSETIPIEFEGHKGEIIKEMDGETVVIKITCDGVEIARGTMTKKGPDVKLDKKYKAGFLFAKTVQQQVFERAWILIKNLR